MTFVALWAFVCGAMFSLSLTACWRWPREESARSAAAVWLFLLFVALGLS